jgi:uncharacterized membrane protein YeaQ/YmgE (transglycosylase-associated protein family)
MGIIAWIVLGLCAGLIARALVPGRSPHGILAITAAGVLGAIVGGFMAGALFDADPIDEFFDLSTWATAIAGAALLIWIYTMLAGDHRRRRIVG